jgi:aminopeptidase YwaD
MDRDEYCEKARMYLNRLCGVQPNRRTGSPGNHEATDFFVRTVKLWGYALDTTSFACLDYESGKAALSSGGRSYDVYISPFSPGCDVVAELTVVTTIEELEDCSCNGSILLMKGVICAEQLMPKNFVFYNPDHHKRIYALLEKHQPVAIISATRKAPELVGAVYPFPLIEDGDFNIPSVYCTDIVGEEIALKTGKAFRLAMEAKRIPATACNVIDRKRTDAEKKITVSAHIDARENSPGALDDASGIVIQLLLAEMLKDYNGPLGIEIAAFNGEDYYSAGGQMDYLRRYERELCRIAVAINIDDVGYKKGKTAYSLYQCPVEIQEMARTIFSDYQDIKEGEQWYQGDHMIFVQKGKPAVALTAEKMPELMATITHTPKDIPDLIDCKKLVEVAEALRSFILHTPSIYNL